MTGIDIIWAIVLAACTLLGLVGFVLMVRRMPSAFGEWWKSLQGPQIAATDEELAALGTVWPLRPERWPSPMPSGLPRMSKVRCHAYSRLAGARSRASRYAAEVLTVLMAAFLGYQLPAIADIPNRVREASGWEDLRQVYGLLWSISGIAIGLAFAMLCRSRSEDLEIARSYYEQAARATSHTVLDPKEQRSSGKLSRVLDFFR